MNAEAKRQAVKRALVREALEKERAENTELARQAVAPQFSRTEAALAGAAQGLGSDFLDELYGARKAVTDVLPLVGDHPDATLDERYHVNRDEARRYYDRAAEEHPAVYPIGNMVGGGAQVLLPGAKALGLAAGPGASAARKLGTTALSSGAAGLGASESESALGNVEDAVISAGAGVALDKLGNKIGGKIKGGLRKRANEKAVIASGAKTAEVRELRKKGLLDSHGRWLLERGIVSPLSSLEDVAERSKAIKENAGMVIGGVIDEADRLRGEAVTGVRAALGATDPALATPEQLSKLAAVEGMINEEFGYSFNNVADRIEQLIARDDKIGAARFHREKLEGLVDEFRRIGADGPGTLREGLRNKTEQRRLLGTVDNLSEDYKQEVYDIISGELERSVSGFERLQAGVQKMYGNAADNMVAAADVDPRMLPPSTLPVPSGPTPGAPPPSVAGAPVIPEGQAVVDTFKNANREYAGAANAQRTAERRLDTVATNRDFGLTTGQALWGGAAAGGAPVALAAAVGNNFFRQYGSSLQASLFHKAANVIEKGGAIGASQPMLKEALRKGPTQFIAAQLVAMKTDPKAKAWMETQMLGDPEAAFSGATNVVIDDPETLAAVADQINQHDGIDTIEKAKLLSDMGKRGVVEINLEAPAPPAPVAQKPRRAGNLSDLLNVFGSTAS
jgi:hypothetical protein